MNRRAGGALIAAWVAALMVWQAAPAAAAPGDVDPMFHGGTPYDFTVPFSSCGTNCHLEDVARMGGRTLVAGTVDDFPNRKFGLVLLSSQGYFDGSFGGGKGNVVTSPPHGEAFLNDVAVLSNGKILAAGIMRANDRGRFLIFRYLSNGTVDASFGKGGHTTLSFTQPVEFHPTIALLPGGEFLIAGTIAKHEGDGTLILARFHGNGHLDHAFGNDGVVRARYPNAPATEADAMRVDPHGRIVVGGSVSRSGPNDYRDVFVGRFLANGRRDRSFSSDGLARKDLGQNDGISSIALQGSRIVGAGGLNSGFAESDMLLVRLRGDGKLDPTFGGDGVRTPNFGTNEHLNALAIAPGGKLVGSGFVDSDFAVARFKPRGGADGTFGTGGVEIVDNPSGSGEAEGVYVKADQRIVAGGRIEVATNTYQWRVVRLQGT